MYRTLAPLACGLIFCGHFLAPVAAQTVAGEANALRAPAPAAAEAPSAAAPSADTDDAARPDEKLEQQPPAVKGELQTRLKALDNAALSPEDKRKAADLYQQAIESFDAANQQIEAARRFEADLENFKTKAAQDEVKLSNPLKPYDDLSGEPLPKVEEVAANVETWLKVYRDELAAVEAEPKRRSKRLAELPKQISDAQQKLDQTASELSALGGEEATDAVGAARRAALAQQAIMLRAMLEALDREQRLYQQGGDWLKVRHEYLARYVPYKERRLAQLRSDINLRRERDAQQQAETAKRVEVEAAKEVRPRAIAELATKNKQMAEGRAQIAADITDVTRQLDAARSALQKLNDQFTRSKKQDEVDELSHLNGQLLRDQRTKLPDVRSLRRATARRESERAEILLRLYNLNDDRSALANVEERANQLAAHAGDLSDQVRGEFRRLLEAQKEILEPYIKDCEKYSSNLAELHSVESELISATDDYAAFIAQRVLWIRSCSIVSAADWRPAAGALAWSLDPGNWRDAGATLRQAARRQPALFAAFAVALTAVLAGQRTARRRLRAIGEEAKKRNCTKLRPTIDALGLTVLAALPWPMLLGFLGWSMDSLSEAEFARALGAALRFTAVCLLLVELARHLFRQVGLADAHFDWPEACLAHLRRKLRWITALGLPLVLWLTGLEVQQHEPLWSSSLGRACFIAVMLLLAALLHRLLLARNSPFRQIVLISGGGWLTPLQISWRPAAVLLPAALAVLAAVGYYFTAQQAAVRVLETVAMLLAVATLGGLTRRWLLVNRRRLAREQAKQRRAALAAAAEADPTGVLPTDAADDAIDLAAISEQTQKLVRTFLAATTALGLIFIWGEILPALAYPAGHTLPWAKELTWGDLATFVLVVAATYVSVRDVPALLELVVLQHLPLDGGSRYAFTAVSRYLLTAVGLTAAFNSIGGQWSEIQWLVAAMSVGLGFGLQEIFANFVSGIILLFERPIRVGDIVTLGDKTGVVSRIRMRATTIVDWDRKEYIVPNKDLVTERLLNWTLSDQMNRIEILLTLAHGADTDRACELLLEAVREQPYILTEPAASAAFEGINEHGLKLALRCYLPTLEHRGATIHGLYTKIDHKLRAANIEVAAPPREMRLRMSHDDPALTSKHTKAVTEKHSAA